MQNKFEFVGEVRGLGLMQAMDLTGSGAPSAPDPAFRDRVIQAAFRQGLLLLGCGESAVRFCPPLCVTAQQVQTALTILEQILPAQFAAHS
jgi:4-aminobutyrate aminotransferase